MRKIELDTIDRLFILLERLSGVAYLKSLLESEFEFDSSYKQKLNKPEKTASDLLLDTEVYLINEMWNALDEIQ